MQNWIEQKFPKGNDTFHPRRDASGRLDLNDIVTNSTTGHSMRSVTTSGFAITLNENRIIWCAIIFHGAGLKLFARVQRSMQAVQCIYFGRCDSRNRSLWTMLGFPLMFIEFILLTSINYKPRTGLWGSWTMQHFASRIYYHVLRFRSTIVHLRDVIHSCSRTRQIFWGK